MALIRWEPARELHTIQQEFNRLFGTAFDSHTGSGPSARRAWVPAVDLVEDGDSYVLRADLPGVGEEDVKVEVEENVLRITGERSTEKSESRDGFYRLERSSGSFARSLRLPEGVDADRIEATYTDGVLELRIPKPEEQKPRRVAISVGAKSAPAEPAAEGEQPEAA
jgi:HSP20 family protein